MLALKENLFNNYITKKTIFIPVKKLENLAINIDIIVIIIVS